MSYTDRLQTPALVRQLLRQDSANPYRWADYADMLSTHGDDPAARAAFNRAVALGPHLPPILVRAANFEFAAGRRDTAVPLAARVLLLTPAYDEILFTYLTQTRTTMPPPGIPADKRAATAFLNWQLPRASDSDVLATWDWLTARRLADAPTTSNFLWALWNRKSYAAAARAAGPNPPPNSPFDWTITPHPAVQATRDPSGIHLTFTASDNVAYGHLRRNFVLPPGSYLLTIRVGARDLTTNECPFFRLSSPNGVDLFTPQLHGTGRTTLTLPFTLTTQSPLTLQLQRNPSQKFDNKIGGQLDITGITLSSAHAQK